MPEDEVQRNILEAIQPPAGDWTNTHTESTFAVLIGSVAAIFECKRIIENYINRHNGFTTQLAWDIQRLYNDFKSAIRDDTSIDWQHNENFSLWSMGFFLNKAQGNIAAAIDKCVNAWLGLALKINFEEETQNDNEGLFYPYISLRLRTIEALVKKESAKQAIADLREGFLKCTSTHDAAKQIRDSSYALSQRYYRPSFDGLFKNLQYTDEHCVAIIFHRVNSFKHSVVRVPDRFGVTNIMEAAITARAIIGVGKFWKEMMENTKLAA